MAITPIGIDLGTTNSAVATIDESGRSVMIDNAEGDLLTPSVVLFSDNEVVVGKEARKANTIAPDLIAQWVKRDIGHEKYSHPIHGQYLPPEVIEACILRKLKADLGARFGADCRCVITVPAYFDEPRRKATADAGQMAGLSVLDIVNEPMAAALAFGETLGYLNQSASPQKELTVLVYDLGGGTFDVTLLRLSQGNVQTLATDGDVQLGGFDWDQRLADYVAEQFIRQNGHDPRQDLAGMNRLLNAVVDAKHTLSARNQATVHLEHAGRSGDVEVTREKFEELTADLLERTSYTCRQLLVEAGMEWTHVDRVLLVGGSTRMPMVGKMIGQISSITPDHSVNPDEAVARGAAVYASYLLAKGVKGSPPPAFEVTNVNSHSLGVEGIDPDTMRKSNIVMIPRNTPLPAGKKERFTTSREGQPSIVVKVLEGESTLPDQCTPIGRMVVRDLPMGLPKGWPIEVTFKYGSNSRLHVKAVVPGTHSEMKLTLERSVGLSSVKLNAWKEVVGTGGTRSSFEAVAEAVPVAEAQPSAASAPPTPARQPQPSSKTPPPLKLPGESEEKIPRWVTTAVKYGLSAMVGFVAAYLVISLIRPDIFPPPW